MKHQANSNIRVSTSTGMMAALQHENAGNAAPLGDPAKVAQVVLAVPGMAEPPLRLILGSDAYAYATAAARVRAESDAAWHNLTISTDRDDSTEAERGPARPGTRLAVMRSNGCARRIAGCSAGIGMVR
jgi:hypothetical protein